MFQFLLREESATALQGRLDTARLREDESLRWVRLGDLGSAGRVSKEAVDLLTAAGEGQADAQKGDFGITLVPKRSVEVMARLDGLGKLVDATAQGVGGSRAVLKQVMQRRQEAISAYGRLDLDEAQRLTDEAAALLPGVAQTNAEDFKNVWALQKNIAYGHARYQAINWTRPMLAMSEQLTLVLVLMLAFGVIFELPIVMALLGMVGLVKSKWLMKYQRHAFVVCLILAAFITPTGDAVNLAMMAGPMLACYEIGVLAVWLIEKRRGRNQAESAITPTT
jgi:sec-independent protein translocase protein TatC